MISRICTLFFLLSIPQWLLAQDIPDFSANYQVSLNGLSAGELKRVLSTNNDGTRTFASQIQTKGMFAFFKPDLIEETSVWSYQKEAILPHSYLYQRTGGKKEKFQHLTFDWQTQQVLVDDNKQQINIAIKPKTYDKLIYQLALMADLEMQKKELSYLIADGSKLKTYNITMLGTETITTSLGKVATIKLTRLHDNTKKQRQTTLWCAPQLHFLPIKIEHIEKNGTRFTAELRQIKGISTDNVFKTTSAETVGLSSP